MKKLAIIVVGVIVLLIAAVFVAPSVIDFKPLIASRVKAATGRDLKIDGALRLSLLPSLSVSAAGVHLSNAAGAKAAEMVTIGAVDLQAELWPLIGGRFVIDSLTVTNPTVNLEVAKDGTPNWAFAPAGGSAASAPSSGQAASAGAAPPNLSLGDVKITGGQVSYVDDTTGQTVDAKNINLDAAMAAISTPLTLKGQMTLNDEPVTADIAIDSLGKLQQGQQAKVKLAVNTKQLTAAFDGGAQERPVPGLDGTFDLNVGSVGALLAWLHRPLEKSQPDPGALKVHAVFAANGATSTLKEGTIQGGALKLTASGSLDASGPVTALALNLDGGVLDLDRYLPSPGKPAAAAGAAPAAAPSSAKGGPALASDMSNFAATLRKTNADIKVTLAGIKAMGYEVGRVAFTATSKGGVAHAELGELALYGGSAKGTVTLDASHDALGINTSMKIDHITVDKLAALAGVPATGVVSATLDAAAQGKDTTALLASLNGKLALDLGGVNAKGAALPAISGLKLEVDLPGGDKQPTLKANLTYNREQVEADATLGPLQKLLGGGKFPAKLTLSSPLVTVAYDGSLQPPPALALDGTFDLDAPSAGKLAAWLGYPLDPKQPDPGLLKVHATLTSDGPKTSVKDASITGKAIKISAEMQYDGSKPLAAVSAKLNIEQADLNSYLPPEGASTGKSAAPAAKGAAAPAAASGWSTAPFGLLALLQEYGGDATLQLASVQYRDLDVKQGELKATAANKVLNVSLDKLSLAQGTISGKLTFDASAAVPKLDYQLSVAGVQALPLLKTFADNSRLSGTLACEMSGQGSGKSEKELVGTLSGKGQLKITNGAIHGINIAQAMRVIGTAGIGGSQTEQTDFTELSGTYTMKDGILTNSDLTMDAPLVRLSGKGTVPFPPQTLDYTVEAKLVATTQGQGGKDALAGVPIPIKISGPWSNPSYQPDMNVLKSIPGLLGGAAKGLGLPIPGAPGGSTQTPSAGSVTKTLKGLFGK
ncbi:MAG: AsmA family protein [Alphaproteobacteria bacterium]